MRFVILIRWWLFIISFYQFVIYASRLCMAGPIVCLSVCLRVGFGVKCIGVFVQGLRSKRSRRFASFGVVSMFIKEKRNLHKPNLLWKWLILINSIVAMPFQLIYLIKAIPFHAIGEIILTGMNQQGQDPTDTKRKKQKNAQKHINNVIMWSLLNDLYSINYIDKVKHIR